VLGKVKAGGGRDRSDAPVEAFDHAISSGGPGRDQAMAEVCVGQHRPGWPVGWRWPGGA